MKEKKVTSLKIIFKDGNDYSLACEVGLDKDEVAKYIERAFRPEPAEPLIKDEKIRKAVRAWADINGVHNCDHLRYDKGCQSLSDIYTRNEISFNYKFETLDDGKEYTIAELCGEED